MPRPPGVHEPGRPPHPPGWGAPEDWLVPARRRRRFPGTALVLALVGILAVVLGGGAGLYYVLSGHTPGDPQLPPARIADTVLEAVPGGDVDGLHQVIGDVAAVGNTVVAAGSEYGGSIGRAQFLVSNDGGSTWRVAPVTVAEGGQLDGSAPSKVFGTSGGWLAFGGPSDRRTVWTSSDGRSWSQLGGGSDAFGVRDEVAQIARTSSGYVAAGYHAAGGDQRADLPVLWRSPNGTSWQRIGPDEVRLPTDGDTVGQLRFAAARGNVIVVGGDVVKGDEVADGLWRSTDAGRTWEPIDVPQADGSTGRVRGITANRFGFFALRQGGKDNHGVVLTSQDGAAWKPVGTLEPSGVEIADLQRIAGNDEGLAVLANTESDRSVVYRSGDGRRWEAPADLGENSFRALSSLTPAPGGSTIVVGTRLDSDQDPYLALARGTTRATEIEPQTVPGAVHQERTLRAIAAGDGNTVAVGSANGDAAAWISAGGSAGENSWTPARKDSLDGYGQQRLSGVAYGEAGWLAVGTDETDPLVATSEDALSWSRVDDELFEEGSWYRRAAAAAYGPAGYVVVGAERREGSLVEAAAWRSTDLESWERADDPDLENSEGGGWRWTGDVTADSARYVAVGAIGDPDAPGPRKERPAIWMSQDGMSWDVHQPTLPAEASYGYLSRAAIKGSTVAALGVGQSANGAFLFSVVSNDGGKTWRSVRLPDESRAAELETGAIAMTPTAEGFAAVSTSGAPATYDVVLWTSTDGASWRPITPRGTGLSGGGTQRVHGLTMLGGRLVGVGTSADFEGEHVTLWRTPPP
ncbi:MAG: hypothetical protein GEV03_08615 [Streptosporangiales bacterium]|nr:hypothetical protein [Streptosporangiales bacterium]